MNIFYCDIEGTITNGTFDTLISCLNKIIEKDNLDKLYFSFISSDTLDTIKIYLKTFIPFLEKTKIVLGTQFCGNYRIDSNGNITENPFHSKADQIMNDIRDKNPSQIYYADDQLMNVLVATAVMKIKFPSVKFITFSPGTFLNEEGSYGSDEKDMKGLTKAINKYNDIKKI